jgi:hypothetical protein
LGVVVGAAAVAVGPALAAGAGADPAALVQRFSASPAGRVLLAPFQPFARTFTADAVFPTLVGWAAAAAAVNGVLLALTLWLDANYLEAAAAASRRVYERLQRVRQGGPGAAFGLGGGRAAEDAGDDGQPCPAGTSGRAAWRFHVPRLPWLGGAGPLAWRQLTAVARRAGGLLLVTVLPVVAFSVFFVAGGGRPGVDRQKLLIPAVAGFTVLLLANLKFDFRGDLDQMPWLKSLPVRTWAVAAGQLAAPVLLLAACQLLMLAAAGVAATPAARVRLAAAAALALPLDVFLVAVENLLFLLFPVRGAATPAELGAMGRQVVLFFVKGLTVILAGGAAAGLAALTLAFSHSAVLAVVVAFCTLAALAAGLVPVVAMAYGRFDPSRDTPP